MWVDQQRVELPPPADWEKLNLDQLIDVKNKLLDKVFMAKGNQAYLKPLNEALKRVEALITLRLNDPNR